jgi:hypothetical protein
MSQAIQPPLAPAPAPAESPPPTPQPGAPAWLVATRVVRGVIVLAIVAFHLVVLAIRNPLDLWDKEIREELRELPRWGGAAAADPDRPEPYSYWGDEKFKERYLKADRFTWKFTNTVGLEQRWTMFSPPMARKGDFLAVRLEFTDGSQEMIRSDNEPTDPTSYLRVGGWQIRKLEDYLAWPSESALSDAKEKKLWEGYARHVIKKWRDARPNDPRTLSLVVFVRRRLYFPEPGQTHKDVPPPYEKDVATFDANGKLLP